MSGLEKSKQPSEQELLPSSAQGPLVFISHDGRDAELAQAFAKLLKSVSAGMIKTFRASDKKGKEGIEFGEEWFKRLMEQLQSTTDVVCLFTERSLDRPWILFEAGVAKGKLNTPVFGIALGVSLNRVNTGPFYQFMNMDDSEADLTKLVNQLAGRVTGLDVDGDVVKSQIKAFKENESEILKKLSSGNSRSGVIEDPVQGAVAKLSEELKALPHRIAERLTESGDLFRRRRHRRFHPMMIDELMHMSGEPGDPVAVLMAASMMRDDMPWMYELATEVYRAAKGGDVEAIEREMHRLRHFSDLLAHGPFRDEMGFGRDEFQMFVAVFQRMLDLTLRRALHEKKTRPSQKPSKTRAIPEPGE